MSPVEWKDLLELADDLARERFFLASEHKQLLQLNDKLCRSSSKLAQQIWVASQLRANLHHTILLGKNPAACCQRLNHLERTTFIDARKRLGFVEVQNYGNFLFTLRNSPQMLASCLSEAEKLGIITPAMAGALAHTLVGGLFGGCVFTEDEYLILKLLRHLVVQQVVAHSDPSRMLRPSSSMFSRLYSVWNEALFAAKLFLTSALHDPILHMLSEDDTYLDADPGKVLMRFTSEEKLKKFGSASVTANDEVVKKYREELVNRLYTAVNRFIEGIKNSMFLFPMPIKWIVGQVHALLTESRKVDARQVSIMCTDLIFGSYICPVIVNPELFGITELLMSDIARFNLTQIAQILQRLAMWQWQEVDAKIMDLYSKFDKNCLWSIMEEILEGSQSLDEEGDKLAALPGLTRMAVLLSENELHNLVSVMQSVGASCSEEVDSKTLSELLSHLPLISLQRNQSLAQTSLPTSFQKTDKAKAKANRTMSAPPGTLAGTADEKVNEDHSDNIPEEVLVIPFGNESLECVGMLPESKFLEDNNMSICLNAQAAQAHTQEKRTRFSLSHDDGSIVSAGNVSDNLEAVSEAASNHSAASSLDIEEGEEGEEDQQDNLSDMVSANVSGRGTPSISGRDTPSSQVTESEEAASVNQAQQRNLPENNRPSAQLGELPDPPVAPSVMPPPKQHSRTDIDDKFGKFEIKKLIEGDETFSLVSDTWSTDVLASDSETVEHSSEHNFPVGHPMSMQQAMRNNDHNIPMAAMLDVSETASEAWSTDVMASDSERMGEVDTDDAGSVARSDDVGRSEIDGDSNRDNRDTPPLISALSFRPIRVELPVLRELSTHTVVTPKVSLNVSNVALLNNNDLYLPPSPPISVSAAGSDARDDNEVEIKSKKAEASNARTYDSSDGKQTVGLDVETGASPIPRLSTTSLASSSSSSMGTGSDLRGQSNTPVLQENCVELRADSAVLDHKISNISSSSTGAIPKSISFDKTAERGDKDVDDEPKNKRGSFFRNIKLPFKSRGRKTSRPGFEDSRGNSDSNDSVFRNRRKGEESTLDSEDILAKYRRKPNGQPPNLRQDSKEGRENGIDEDESEDGHLHIDPLHPELSYAFTDAKRKLRLVLSTIDTDGIGRNILDKRNKRGRASEKLVMLLKLLLTEAINVQNEASIAQIHEALRCVNLFDDAACRKLIQGLKDDYFKRAPFVAYITRSKSGLLSTHSTIKKLLERSDKERSTCSKYLIKMCVHLYLEQQEEKILEFEVNFQQLQMPDEKTELLYTILDELVADMERDPLWRIANDGKLEMAKQIVEQTVISRVYLNALYPNGEGDIMRDQVLHEHMKHLSQIITLNHKDLRIPKAFQYECPWPSAQAKISVLGACKTPRDKLHCVVDCAKTIMRLLEMAHNRSAPAADDFTPVLVYVLIKANPPSLLSTVQYVNNYYGSQMAGEEEYWWVQFCSAIEYIKTMD